MSFTVCVEVDGDEVDVCSLAELLGANEDGLDTEDRAAIAGLTPGESHSGGGGAAPEWRVTRLPEPTHIGMHGAPCACTPQGRREARRGCAERCPCHGERHRDCPLAQAVHRALRSAHDGARDDSARLLPALRGRHAMGVDRVGRVRSGEAERFDAAGSGLEVVMEAMVSVDTVAAPERRVLFTLGRNEHIDEDVLDAETRASVDALAAEILERGAFGDAPDAWEITAAFGRPIFGLAHDDGRLRLLVARVDGETCIAITERVSVQRRGELALLGVAFLALVRRGIVDAPSNALAPLTHPAVAIATAAAQRLTRALLVPRETLAAALERGEDLRARFPRASSATLRARLRDLRGGAPTARAAA